MYFQAKGDAGSIQIDDNSKFYNFYRKHTLGEFDMVRQGPVKYGLSGESVTTRTAYYFAINGYYSTNQIVPYLILYRNPTTTPIHIFTSEFQDVINYLYSTAYYPTVFSRTRWIAVTNCTLAQAQAIECYVFSYDSRPSSASVGIEVRDANNNVIFNSNSKILKVMDMAEVQHCTYGSESGSGTDLNKSTTYEKDIALFVGYRGLYNLGSTDVYNLSKTAHFPVPILTKNKLEIKTCTNNAIVKDASLNEEGGTCSDIFTTITGFAPCNRTNYFVADVTGY